MSELPKPSESSINVTERLISFWELHHGFDANMSSLASSAAVSRDTVYRWLHRKAYPREEKVELIEAWLGRRE